MRPTLSLLDIAKDQPDLDEKEQWWIAYLNCGGYQLVNMNEGGGGPWGREVSQETREKLASSNTGVPHPKHTEEWKKDMSKKMSGRNTNTPEHMEKLRQSRIGAKHSDDAKAAISRKKTGVKLTDEHRQNIAASNIGKKMSAECLAKRSGDKHGCYRHEISTDLILQRIKEGFTKTSIAAELGVSSTFIHRRLNQHRKSNQV
jgi:hypothetical protein